MLRHELKKLFVKNWGIFAVLFVMICEVVCLDFIYPQPNFESDIDKRHFEEYMSEFSGKLTTEKEEKILAEQEAILDAYNAEQMIMIKLRRGEFSTEEEFNTEIEKTSALTERRTAFNMLLTKYYYASENPENRYILTGNYNGISVDYPDVFFLLLVILMTATLFLNEESSNVITFIRITQNGKSRTLSAKILSLVIMIFWVRLFGTCAEFIFICFRGSFDELMFPLQSINYFGTSEYSISILDAFVAVSAIRTLGYLFVAAAVILFSVTLKRPLFTVFIPSALCLLQQFLFDPATPAYYFPTGLLRAVGYFRGSEADVTAFSQTIKGYTAIPKTHFALILIMTIAFIAVSIIFAAKYYGCLPLKINKKIASAVMVFVLTLMLSGCSEHDSESIIFNVGKSNSIAQNSEYIFISDNNGITAVSKSDETRTQLLHDPFYSSEYSLTITTVGGDLYYHNRPGGAENYSVYKLSSDGFRQSTVMPPFDTTGSAKNYGAGFLGLSLNADDSLTGSVYSFFTDGQDIYYIFLGGGVYKFINNKRECVIPESAVRDEMAFSFDGEKIYYISKKLELMSYDIATEETTRIAGNFVEAVCCDGTRVLFSNKGGIFSFDPADKSIQKLSSVQADSISSDGTSVVYSKNGLLYLLGNDTPVYDSTWWSFEIVSGQDKLAVIFDTECTFVDLLE